MSHIPFTHCTLRSFWGARLYFALINQRLGVFKRFFWLVNASKEMSSKCQGLASQQGAIPKVWRCRCSQSTSQLLTGVAQPQNNIWEAKKNLHPHLGFSPSMNWKGFQEDWEVVGKTRLVGIGSVPQGGDSWLVPQGQLQSPGSLGHLLAATLFLEGKGAAIPSPAQSTETFILPLRWNDPSWGLKIGLRRWHGRSTQGKIGWSMFNKTALKCT